MPRVNVRLDDELAIVEMLDLDLGHSGLAKAARRQHRLSIREESRLIEVYKIDEAALTKRLGCRST